MGEAEETFRWPRLADSQVFDRQPLRELVENERGEHHDPRQRISEFRAGGLVAVASLVVGQNDRSGSR